MKKIHQQPPRKRIALGVPFEDAIQKFLLPKTNTGNMSSNWSVTDWVRYAVAKEIGRRNGGKIPRECKDLLKSFIKDLDL